ASFTIALGLVVSTLSCYRCFPIAVLAREGGLLALGMILLAVGLLPWFNVSPSLVIPQPVMFLAGLSLLDNASGLVVALVNPLNRFAPFGFRSIVYFFNVDVVIVIALFYAVSTVICIW